MFVLYDCNITSKASPFTSLEVTMNKSKCFDKFEAFSLLKVMECNICYSNISQKLWIFFKMEECVSVWTDNQTDDAKWRPEATKPITTHDMTTNFVLRLEMDCWLIDEWMIHSFIHYYFKYEHWTPKTIHYHYFNDIDWIWQPRFNSILHFAGVSITVAVKRYSTLLYTYHLLYV